jgi:hypothetical protein
VSSGFVSLGLGRFVRADRVLALEPIEGDERGPGNRTRVWLDGLAQPIVAARSETAILADLGGAAQEAPEQRERGRRKRGEDPPSLF